MRSRRMPVGNSKKGGKLYIGKSAEKKAR